MREREREREERERRGRDRAEERFKETYFSLRSLSVNEALIRASRYA